MKIVFIWIQWSGKWTQWRILAEKHGFKIYETGTALREIASQNTPLWEFVKSTIDAGKQVNPEIVENILQEVITQNKENNLILDWFVRNEWNKLSADKIVWEYTVVFFDLPETDAKARLLGRMYDKETGETFPTGTILNPKNWNILIQRADDEEQAINERIRLFYEKTMPIVETYRKQGNLIEIDAKGTIDEISLRLEKTLGL
jgi:adenylate kinase